MPCKREIEREVRVILQIMLKKPHHIKKLPMQQMALYRNRTGQAIFVRKLPLKLVEYMSENGWIKRDKDQYEHTEQGVEWLSKFIYFVDLSAKPEAAYENKIDYKTGDSNLVNNFNNQSDIAYLSVDADFSPILKLYNRQKNLSNKYLTDIHLQAGHRLFELYVKTRRQPNITMNWDRLQTAPQPHYTGGKDDGYSENTYVARQQLNEILQLLGRDFAAVVVEICLFGNGLEATEKTMSWPARSAKLLLTMALDRLAIYYQILPNELVRDRYLAWAASDLGQNGAEPHNTNRASH